MEQTIAIVRQPPRSLGDCELTHLTMRPIDYDIACEQHEAYVQALVEAGCTVRSLAALEAFPDGAFVEDVAIVLDEIAIATRPGAASRRGEVAHMIPSLRMHRSVVVQLPPSATLDGGDVMRHGRTLYVGQSTRSSPAGAAALAAATADLGYRVKPVLVTGALHLKTACTFVDDHTVLANPRWIDSRPFTNAGFKLLQADPAEPFASNTLKIGDRLLVDSSAPKTAERLRQLGYHVIELSIGEFAKAEAGLTCLSLIFSAPS